MSLHLRAFPAAFCKMSEVTFRLREAIVLGAIAFIIRQSVGVVVVQLLLLVTLGVRFVSIVFREPPHLLSMEFVVRSLHWAKDAT